MKKIIFLTSLLALLVGCFVKERKLLCNPDKQFCLSQFDYTDTDGKSFTIFTYGDYEGNRLPGSYIKVRNTWRNTWYCLVEWKGESAYLYYIYNDFEPFNIDNSNLNLVKMYSEDEFFSYFYDKVPNDYLKISSIK